MFKGSTEECGYPNKEGFLLRRMKVGSRGMLFNCIKCSIINNHCFISCIVLNTFTFFFYIFFTTPYHLQLPYYFIDQKEEKYKKWILQVTCSFVKPFAVKLGSRCLSSFLLLLDFSVHFSVCFLERNRLHSQKLFSIIPVSQ